MQEKSSPQAITYFYGTILAEKFIVAFIQIFRVEDFVRFDLCTN